MRPQKRGLWPSDHSNLSCVYDEGCADKRMRDNKLLVWPSDVRMKGTSKVREKGVN